MGGDCLGELVLGRGGDGWAWERSTDLVHQILAALEGGDVALDELDGGRAELETAGAEGWCRGGVVVCQYELGARDGEGLGQALADDSDGAWDVVSM